MPERILRDLTDSEHYNSVAVHARDLFIRFVNKADDYGLYFADAKRLRPLLYPLLLDQVRETDLQRWTAECAKAGLVRLYSVGGREYLQVCRWGKQRLRNKKPKFPAPPWGLEISAMHPHGNRSADDGHPPSDAETDADTEPPKPPTGGRERRGKRRREREQAVDAEIANVLKGVPDGSPGSNGDRQTHLGTVAHDNGSADRRDAEIAARA